MLQIPDFFRSRNQETTVLIFATKGEDYRYPGFKDAIGHRFRNLLLAQESEKMQLNERNTIGVFKTTNASFTKLQDPFPKLQHRYKKRRLWNFEKSWLAAIDNFETNDTWNN